MKTIPFVHEGLGNSSYVVDLGNGSAVIIDPDRSVQKYAGALEAAGLKAAAIVETHLHADFVSGAHDLAAQTGAPIFLSTAAESKLPHRPLRGGQVLTLDGGEVLPGFRLSLKELFARVPRAKRKRPSTGRKKSR